MGRLILVLGGARSGKSTWAQNYAEENGRSVLFVATAQAFDEEMRSRITRHRDERPVSWRTLEAPLATGEAVRQALGDADLVLVDCLTLLASNALLTLPEDAQQEEANAAILAEVEELLAVCAESQVTWLIVSNEVGMGIVPPSRLGRLYRDALGRANQRVASAADEVLLLVAGLPWWLKGK